MSGHTSRCERRRLSLPCLICGLSCSLDTRFAYVPLKCSRSLVSSACQTTWCIFHSGWRKHGLPYPRPHHGYFLAPYPFANKFEHLIEDRNKLLHAIIALVKDLFYDLGVRRSDNEQAKWTGNKNVIRVFWFQDSHRSQTQNNGKDFIGCVQLKCNAFT